MSVIADSRSSIHDEELRKLYEEMEQQMRQEKDRITAQVYRMFTINSIFSLAFLETKQTIICRDIGL